MLFGYLSYSMLRGTMSALGTIDTWTIVLFPVWIAMAATALTPAIFAAMLVHEAIWPEGEDSDGQDGMHE